MRSYRIFLWCFLLPFSGLLASTQGACVCVTPTFLPASCVTDRDCSGLSCVNGQCQNSNPTCTSNANCTAPMTCINRRCSLPTTCTDGETILCRIGAGSGPCDDGKRTCQSGAWSKCEPVAGNQAKPETCNGQDDDCDGKVDESFAEKFQVCTVANALGPCSQGLYSCSNGTLVCLTTYQPLPEQAGANNCGDGIDNDCDGKTDNDDDGCKACNPGETQLCYTGPAATQGVGPCKSGTQTCQSQGGFGPCVGQVIPVAEVCGNNVDDNCDGKIDDGCQVSCSSGESRPCYSGPPHTKNVGLCKEGNQLCVNGVWGACDGEVLPVTLPCEEGKDKNCDGKPDNCQIPGDCKEGEARECYGAATGCKLQPDGRFLCEGLCRPGKQICNSSLQWEPCQGGIQPTTEICNNLQDEDCDGKADNGCATQEVLTSSWETLAPLKLWDTQQKTTLRTYTGGHADIVYVARFNNNGTLFATGGQDGQVILWNTMTGQKLWAKKDHAASVHALAFDAKDRWLASASSNGTLYLWEIKTGTVLHKLTGHQGGIYALATSSTGEWLASAGSDTNVFLWDTTPFPPTLKATLKGHTQDVYALAFSPRSERLASGGRDTSLLLWDTTTQKLSATLRSHTQGITSLAFNPSGNSLASGSSDQSIKIWLLAATPPSLQKTFPTPNNDPVYTLSFHSRGNLLASGTYNGKLLIWDVTTGQISADIQAHTGTVSSVSFRP